MPQFSECTILIVDDTEANVDLLVEALGEDYDLAVAMDGQSALRIANETPPDLILLDIMMPGMDGYEVCERLKAHSATQSIPVVFLTAMSGDEDEAKGLALGAVDYVTKPFNPGLVKARVRNHLELKLHRDHLEELVKERTRDLLLTQDATIESMAILAECRDPETGGHIKRTQNYVRALAIRLKECPGLSRALDDATVDLLCKSAPLHDIGKVGVRDEVLLKPGKLTDEEFREMKKHTVYGRNAIAAVEKRLGANSFLGVAREVAYTHHERWNGSGYPEGLSGTAIPISGRLMAVADVFDALISKRVYKPPFTFTKAAAIIAADSGTHFDPEVGRAFVEVQEQFRQIALEFADFEEERRALSE
jgi:putative two-component system response regulator